MISDNCWKPLQCLAWLAALFLLNACAGKQVVVEGWFPPPVMNKIPLTVGIWYGDDFANHEFFDETKSKTESDWLVKTGQAQVQMWNALFAGMFEHTVRLEAMPSPANSDHAVDFVLIPHVDDLQYSLPAQTNVKIYEIWFRYRFEMVSANGDKLAEWFMTAYGKTPTAFMRSAEKAVNLAAVMALRDAGAHFIISFEQQPAIQQWSQQTKLTNYE